MSRPSRLYDGAARALFDAQQRRRRDEQGRVTGLSPEPGAEEDDAGAPSSPAVLAQVFPPQSETRPSDVPTSMPVRTVSAAPRLQFRISAADTPESVLELAAGENTIGRGPDCAIQLGARTVSGRHATVVVDSMRVTIRDDDSTNGTWVNGIPITAPTGISTGDTVRIGPYQLRLERTVDGTAQPHESTADRLFSRG
jgi:FHA domain-containing protein